MFDKEPNIDIVFRNGLKDFEILPPADVWDGIPPVRPVHSWRRRLYPVAATVAIVMTLGAAINMLIRRPSPEIRQLAVATAPAEQNNPFSAETPVQPVAKTVMFTTTDSYSRDSHGHESVINGPLDPSVISLSAENSAEIAGGRGASRRTQVRETPLDVPPLISRVSLYDAGQDIALAETRRNNLPKVLIGASLSPAYSVVSAGSNKAVADKMDNESPMMSYTGAISVALKVNHRLSVESGVALATMGQTVSGVNVYGGLSGYYSSKGTNYAVETASGRLVADNTDLYIADARADRVVSYIPGEILDPSKLKLDLINNEIRQLFRYLEIPLTARYKIIDRKIDLNFSGGLTYGILVENSAYAVMNDKSVKIGHTDGVSNFSFSSQMGLGIGYDIGKNVEVNLQPVFRYYFTPFSDLSGTLTRPYSYGIFSGFFFRF